MLSEVFSGAEYKSRQHFTVFALKKNQTLNCDSKCENIRENRRNWLDKVRLFLLIKASSVFSALDVVQSFMWTVMISLTIGILQLVSCISVQKSKSTYKRHLFFNHAGSANRCSQHIWWNVIPDRNILRRQQKAQQMLLSSRFDVWPGPWPADRQSNCCVTFAG